VGASIAGKESVSVVRVKAPPLAAGEAATGWTRLWTSAVAAGLSEAATMPIDFAKVRLQLQSRAIGSGSAAAGVHYAGMADCIGRTVRAEGPGALFRGIGPALARQCGYTGLSFFLYEPILSRISPNAGRDAGFTNRLLAGGAAGGMGISVLNPMEVVKTQLQAAGDTKTSAPDIIKRILRTDGVLGFWAGIGPNITRTFLVCAAELGTYDEVKTQMVSKNLLQDGPEAHLCASSAAGFASASVSTPVDVIKTRLMNQAGARMAAHSATQQYRGVLDAFVTIVKREGPAALYQGFVPVLTRKVLWCSSFFLTYEALKAPR